MTFKTFMIIKTPFSVFKEGVSSAMLTFKGPILASRLNRRLTTKNLPDLLTIRVSMVAAAATNDGLNLTNQKERAVIYWQKYQRIFREFDSQNTKQKDNKRQNISFAWCRRRIDVRVQRDCVSREVQKTEK